MTGQTFIWRFAAKGTRSGGRGRRSPGCVRVRRLDRYHPLDIPLLRQRPDTIRHEALKVLARKVSIERCLVAINLPQREDVRLFAASADVELDYAGLFA